ncbi:30S ribosomal protein S5 [bacterium]|nr:30S ribosomal protein S5 [bacterium]|tara:strand:+ start:4356 stop:5009 length:654 start_codon:yes stop_codon:yes gene_type:complete
MTEETKKAEISVKEKAPVLEVVGAPAPNVQKGRDVGNNKPSNKSGQHSKNASHAQRSAPHRRRAPQRRMSRPRRTVSEFAKKVIDVRRVTRVVAGGRRFSFSVALVLGNRTGSVGVGVGKATNTALAIEKASRNARKNMIKVKTTKTMSIPHEVEVKLGSARVLLIPVRGKGLVAGSSVRNVLDLAGLTDISAKVLSRSKNKLNNARATIKALRALK